VNELAADLGRVTAAVQKVLRGLSDEDIAALLAGEGTIRFVPKGHHVTPIELRQRAARRSTVRATVNADEVKAHLSAISTEDAAVAYLTGLSLNAAALRTLAAELGLRPTTSQPARAVVADLVRVFVSGRVTNRAVRSY
jgi:hypothetical protein